MKYLFSITIFLSFNLLIDTIESTCNNYNDNNLIATTQISLEDQVYDKLEVKTNLPKMLNKFLDRKALIRTDVPSTLWEEIKNNIDYGGFKTQIVDIIPDFYSDSELQALLNTHSDSPKVPITKMNFRQVLAQKSQNFIDVQFINTVNSILSENGFSAL
ncbi:hypothetical protein [Psychroserpens burtonensis]|uniref:hypothetical protein n=1 Tax=Psychroserpens burtonensis TaxID=49278 RepID=UPI0004004AD6|nr:hypothetical protein [Psychroserpens burtonensis]